MLKLIALFTLALAYPTASHAFAGSCEDGSGDPVLCAELLSNLYQNGKVPALPSVNQDIPVRCYLHSRRTNPDILPDAYSGTLLLRNFVVSTTQASLNRAVAVLVTNTGRNFWYEDSQTFPHYRQLNVRQQALATSYSQPLDTLFVRREISYTENKGQWIVLATLTQREGNRMLVDRTDICISVSH